MGLRLGRLPGRFASDRGEKMTDEQQKGYSVEIPDEAVQDALDSVDRRAKSKTAGGQQAEIEIPVQVEPDDGERPDDSRPAEVGRGPSRQELIEALRKSRDEAKAARDRMLRALADADNQRKRLVKEKQEIIKYNQESLMRDLLVPLDNLERTIEHIPSAADDPAVEALRQGVTMVLRQFEETLAKHHLTGFSALGQKFDPALHEAIQRVEDPQVEPGTVIGEMHRGYKLHDRLLRPALVSVACREGQGDQEPGEAPQADAQPVDDDRDLPDE